MTFATSVGNIDIQVGDLVKTSEEVLPSDPIMKNIFQVVSVSGSDTDRVVVQIPGDTTAISTAWIIQVLRPILPA